MAIAFVQQVGNASTVASPGTALTSTAATFTAGNLLVAIVGWAQSGATASGTIDIPSGWTAPLATKNNGAPNGCSRAYYMANNPGGSQSWTWNVTETGGGTSQGNAYTIFEFSGAGPLDLTAVSGASGASASTSLDSTAASGTTQSGDLLIHLVSVARSAAGTLSTDTTNSVPTTGWNVKTQFDSTNAVPNCHASGQYNILAGTQAAPRGVLTSTISESSESFLLTFGPPSPLKNMAGFLVMSTPHAKPLRRRESNLNHDVGQPNRMVIQPYTLGGRASAVLVQSRLTNGARPVRRRTWQWGRLVESSATLFRDNVLAQMGTEGAAARGRVRGPAMIWPNQSPRDRFPFWPPNPLKSAAGWLVTWFPRPLRRRSGGLRWPAESSSRFLSASAAPPQLNPAGSWITGGQRRPTRPGRWPQAASETTTSYREQVLSQLGTEGTAARGRVRISATRWEQGRSWPSYFGSLVQNPIRTLAEAWVGLSKLRRRGGWRRVIISMNGIAGAAPPLKNAAGYLALWFKRPLRRGGATSLIDQLNRSLAASGSAPPVQPAASWVGGGKRRSRAGQGSRTGDETRTGYWEQALARSSQDSTRGRVRLSPTRWIPLSTWYGYFVGNPQRLLAEAWVGLSKLRRRGGWRRVLISMNGIAVLGNPSSNVWKPLWWRRRQHRLRRRAAYQLRANQAQMAAAVPLKNLAGYLILWYRRALRRRGALWGSADAGSATLTGAVATPSFRPAAQLALSGLHRRPTRAAGWQRTPDETHFSFLESLLARSQSQAASGRLRGSRESARSWAALFNRIPLKNLAGWLVMWSKRPARRRQASWPGSSDQASSNLLPSGAAPQVEPAMTWVGGGKRRPTRAGAWPRSADETRTSYWEQALARAAAQVVSGRLRGSRGQSPLRLFSLPPLKHVAGFLVSWARRPWRRRQGAYPLNLDQQGLSLNLIGALPLAAPAANWVLNGRRAQRRRQPPVRTYDEGRTDFQDQVIALARQQSSSGRLRGSRSGLISLVGALAPFKNAAGWLIMWARRPQRRRLTAYSQSTEAGNASLAGQPARTMAANWVIGGKRRPRQGGAWPRSFDETPSSLLQQGLARSLTQASNGRLRGARSQSPIWLFGLPPLKNLAGNLIAWARRPFRRRAGALWAGFDHSPNALIGLAATPTPRPAANWVLNGQRRASRRTGIWPQTANSPSTLYSDQVLARAVWESSSGRLRGSRTQVGLAAILVIATPLKSAAGNLVGWLRRRRRGGFHFGSPAQTNITFTSPFQTTRVAVNLVQPSRTRSRGGRQSRLIEATQAYLQDNFLARAQAAGSTRRAGFVEKSWNRTTTWTLGIGELVIEFLFVFVRSQRQLLPTEIRDGRILANVRSRLSKVMARFRG